MKLFRRDPGRRAFDLSQEISEWLEKRINSKQPRTSEDFEAAARELIEYAQQLAEQKKERDPVVVTKAIALQRVTASGFGQLGVNIVDEIRAEVARVAVDLLVASGASHPDSERLRAIKAEALRQIEEHKKGK